MASSRYPLGRARVLVMRLRNLRCAYTDRAERAISKRREDEKGKRGLVGVGVGGVGGVGGRGRIEGPLGMGVVGRDPPRPLSPPPGLPLRPETPRPTPPRLAAARLHSLLRRPTMPSTSRGCWQTAAPHRRQQEATSRRGVRREGSCGGARVRAVMRNFKGGPLPPHLPSLAPCGWGRAAKPEPLACAHIATCRDSTRTSGGARGWPCAEGPSVGLGDGKSCRRVTALRNGQADRPSDWLAGG
jgi:hypothetical protein